MRPVWLTLWRTVGVAPTLISATSIPLARTASASDVIVLVAAAVILALISFAAVPSPGFVSAIAAFLDALPGFLGTGWQFAIDLLVLVTIVLVVAMVVRKRWSITRDIVIRAAEDITPSNLIRIGERLSAIAKQYARLTV